MYFELNFPSPFAVRTSVLVPSLVDRFMAPTVKARVDPGTKTIIAIVYDTPFPPDAVAAITADIVRIAKGELAYVKLDGAVAPVGPMAEKHWGTAKAKFIPYSEE